jgi:hypothetical protein
MNRVGKSGREALRGALEIGIALVTPFLRTRRRRWGATDEELERSYPGDALTPLPPGSHHGALNRYMAQPRQSRPHRM